MDRRTLLLRGSTALGAAMVAPRALRALDRSLSLDTLQEAVDTGDPGEVAIFIEDNPRLAGHSPLRVRLAALELLEGDEARRFRESYIYPEEDVVGAATSAASAVAVSIAGFSDVQCIAQQQASGVLLRESSDEDAVWLAGQMGGLNTVRAYLALQAAKSLDTQLTRLRKLMDKE